MSRAFKEACKLAGVAGHFHALRHSHATALLQANEHPKVVADRLGHSSVMVTLDTYSHVVPGMQARAAQRIEEHYAAAMTPAALPAVSTSSAA